ncbi:DNA-binding NarL/FixJ family response regulator [Kibdelosporangium banguiense]|uniref:DNA-binding NarL/FixJ family response regulator n=1 Tax=Kibdelosporangium banguiense TaxID=1365924 RepID=A0ABS4TKA4_9PSEU|nr:response regulator transcription factor [Kibdelosporangium banguiense]MBP2324853.1 DNA-binding NarL/FixJ family response regulator [Kibdelosporangium banguiense]
MITIVAVDDHPMLLKGLQACLDDIGDLELTAVYPSVSALVDSCVRASVVLLDILLPGEPDVADNIRRIRESGAQVVLYTSESRPGILREAVDCGALGLVLKGDPEERIIEAVRAAAAGEHFVSSQLAYSMITDPRADVRLTAREREVLTLVAKGLPRRLIAKQLGISENTLPTYLTRASQRYADAHHPAASPSELAAFALQDGYIELSSERRPMP